MPLKLYNTLHHQKENFEPMTPGKVKLYVCGVTVYDRCHIGHARANVAFDVLYRHLQFKKFEVTYVRNFTDVDDKIIRRSQELNVSWQDLTQRYIGEFDQDMQSLGNLKPQIEPKATDHISQMIAVIEKLIAKNLAYVSQGDVFFKVRNFKEYGKLSKKNIEDLEAGARVEVMEAKSDPLDFALWKSAKPGEPAWDSPWGKGRPGWHIECSAMSMEYLGESFDIHGGGRDLIFPHHENEIAQSEGASGKPFVKYWMHNGFVNINADKMSKSLGNILSIREVLETHDWEAVRAFLLSVHYRSPIDFSEENLHEAAQSLTRYYTTIKRVQDYLKHPTPSPAVQNLSDTESMEKIQKLLTFFQEAMDDDLNTAMAFGHIFDAVRAINKLLDQSVSSEQMIPLCETYLQNTQTIFSVLGCYGDQAKNFFDRQSARVLEKKGIDEVRIAGLIEERKQARLQKDFKRSDAIRNELLANNIVLKDRPDGTTEWSVKE